MASSEKNLSDIKTGSLKEPEKIKIAVVVSEWNEQVTESLYSATFQTLLNEGITRENIIKKSVPGSFELSLGAQWQAEREDIHAVICLGCVIQGETKHFDFICDAVAHGITNVSLKYNKPVVFGVLTTNNLKQALERSGGKHGNKGDEAAATAIGMLSLKY